MSRGIFATSISFLVVMCALTMSFELLAQTAQTAQTQNSPVILTPTWSGQDSPGTFRPRLEVHLSADKKKGFVSFEEDGKRWTSRIYAMWKAEVADLDSDGQDELILGVWSRVTRHNEPSPSRAIWVLRWDSTQLIPVWRGSAMSRPLVDFEIQRIEGRAHLKTMEVADNTHFSTIYAWTGFGFRVLSREVVGK